MITSLLYRRWFIVDMQVRKYNAWPGVVKTERRLRLMIAVLLFVSGLSWAGLGEVSSVSAASPDFSNDAFRAT